MEVCFDGVWGTVCSRGWDRLDANVVCRQIGFSGSGIYTLCMHTGFHTCMTILFNLTIMTTGAVASLNARYGRGSGPVFYADVACGGLEARFTDCSKGEIEETNCDHSQDAGAVCLPGM